MTFVDTSALLAYLDAGDPYHDSATRVLPPVLASGDGLTHDYVVIEADALIHRRLGAGPTERLHAEVIPMLDVVFVDRSLFDRATTAHRAALRRRSSLVDHVSFLVMRDRLLTRAAAFDSDFEAEGFELAT
jgi:predicted nucleic acid-binding protein